MADAFVPLEFPAWIVWGQRAGAEVDFAAFLVAFPDARHHVRDGETEHKYGDGHSFTMPKWKLVGGAYRCRWCGRECPGRRTSWCSDTCNEKFYRVHFWTNLTNYIGLRDVTCRRCGSEDGGPIHGNRYSGWQVDHIKPIRNGGTDHPDNLRLLCHDCHVAVGYEQRAAEKQQLDALDGAA